MKKGMVAGLVLAMTATSGCIPELLAIRTVDEIQRSEYRTEHVSAKPSATVTNCMMETLYGYTDAKGARPYAAVTLQSFGNTQAITLRTQTNLANRMYGGGDELLFLIDNAVEGGTGTKSKIWVNQGLFSAQAYLNTLSGVVKVCL